MIITDILNLSHVLLLISPILIFFINKKHFKGLFKYYVLLVILTPMHWPFFKGECLSTIIAKKMGDFKETTTTSSFSEKYLKWLYKPIAELFGWGWNEDGLNKTVYLHWILNFILVWYYLFFVYGIN